MLESEADRLAMVKAAGGEPFSTGRPEPFYGIWDRPSITSDGLIIPVKDRAPQIDCRESDVVAHELVKGSPITRQADGKQYAVRDFDYDGTGMATILLGE